MSEAAPHATLSPAERRVFLALLAGHTQAQIARATGRSGKTIQTQKRLVYLRLGVSSGAELVAYAQRYGLVRGGG